MLGPTCIFWASLTPFSLQRVCSHEYRLLDHEATRLSAGLDEGLLLLRFPILVYMENAHAYNTNK
jgi:hypothetical protein